MFGRDPNRASFLLAEELFAAGDDRFLPELFECRASGRLGAFAERWYGDGRPWARRALLAYVDDGCDRPGHRPLVKRLFKLAEAAGDDAAMARFLVAFDRLARRVLVTLHRYDWREGRSWSERKLAREAAIPPSAKAAEAAGRFSLATRQYLARRAFRYFRELGRRDPGRYGAAIRAALALYEDAHLDRPERLLDAWGLVNALYWGSPVLERRPRGARVAPGRALSELEPAPLYPEAWKDRFAETFDLLLHARSRTVRAWAAAYLRRRHAAELAALPAREAARLVASEHEEVRALGVELLDAAPDARALGAAEWLELLRAEHLDVLPAVCRLVERHLDPARLSLEECVALAMAPLAPVAELGLGWARSRGLATAGDLERALALRDAPAPGVRAEAAAWLAGEIATSPHARAEHARDMLDSRFADVRERAYALSGEGTRFGDDASIAAALAESPYDDAREHLVRRLAAWERTAGADSVRRVWASALLAVHRGGRLKRDVLDRISDRLVERPEEAADLLPLLAVALRSVRDAERRYALAAVARAAAREPAVAAEAARAIPELRLAGEVSA